MGALQVPRSQGPAGAGHGRPTIRAAWRECFFLYFYFLDRELGFCHVRVRTWFPFTIQVYVNGHEYLDTLAVVDDPAPAHRALDRLVQPVRDVHGRSSRACNPAATADLALFTAVLRGEHTLHLQGFRNRLDDGRYYNTIHVSRAIAPVYQNNTISHSGGHGNSINSRLTMR